MAKSRENPNQLRRPDKKQRERTPYGAQWFADASRELLEATLRQLTLEAQQSRKEVTREAQH